ncbi:hypothetical protein ACNAW0_27975 [Micromonospora sp. SL1-18]|uniref:hypothetical protein n=1 Tax=Micromonospora sp. SL1-18 TaxID=3399128 RepID=UPI003A4D5DCD
MTGLLLDEMYPPALAHRLRERGHDVLAALDGAEPGHDARRGGGCGIRTHEDIAALPVFKTTKLTALTCCYASQRPPCDTNTA